MNTLQSYFADREQFIELLEAVGIRTLEQFAAINPPVILQELHQAKRMLNLKADIPVAPVFKEWVAQALHSSTAPDPESISTPTSGDLPLAVPVHVPGNPVQSPAPGPPLPEKRQFRREPEGSVTPLSAKTPIQHESAYRPARRAPKKEEPKTYLRKKGIKHLTPFRTWLGASSVLLLFLSTLSAIVLIAWMLFHEERGWLIILLCFGPWLLALAMYLSLALPRKCSVCRASPFSFKKYTRNKAAHYLFPLGYVFATALHIFLFRWFRCPACGSAQQLGGESASHPPVRSSEKRT